MYVLIHSSILVPLNYLLHLILPLTNKLCLVFENAIEFNDLGDDDEKEKDTYSVYFVIKCQHLLKYSKWLCLELLELEQEPDIQCFLHYDTQEQELQERMVTRQMLVVLFTCFFQLIPIVLGYSSHE